MRTYHDIHRRRGLDVAHLEGTDLRTADFAGAAFHEAALVEADASRANLRGAKFTEVFAYRGKFVAADFRGADLSGTNFVLADLRRSDWRGAGASTVFLDRARIGGMLVAGFSGDVFGPADVSEGDEGPAELVDGADLEAWFAARGAEVRVRQSSRG